MTPPRFTIPVHACNRPALLHGLLTSLEKNSLYHHDVVVVADAAGELPPWEWTGLVDGVEYPHLAAYLDARGWDGFRGNHIDVRVDNWKSSKWDGGRPIFMYAWTEGIQRGIDLAETEWVLMGVQDDNYFAPNWDHGLVRWIAHALEEEWLAPVHVYTTLQGPVKVLGPGEAAGRARAYWQCFEQWDPAAKRRVVSACRNLAHAKHVILEEHVVEWIHRVGLYKPGVAVREIGGKREQAGECPTLITRRLFREAGGYDMAAWSPAETTLTLTLDNRLGTMGKSKLAVQDSFVLNSWYRVVPDYQLTPGPMGHFYNEDPLVLRADLTHELPA